MPNSTPKSWSGRRASRSMMPVFLVELLPTSQPNHTGLPSCIWRMAAAFKSSMGRLRYFTGLPSFTLPNSFTVKVLWKGLSAVVAFIRLT